MMIFCSYYFLIGIFVSSVNIPNMQDDLTSIDLYEIALNNLWEYKHEVNIKIVDSRRFDSDDSDFSELKEVQLAGKLYHRTSKELFLVQPQDDVLMVLRKIKEDINRNEYIVSINFYEVNEFSNTGYYYSWRIDKSSLEINLFNMLEAPLLNWNSNF